MGGVGEAAGHEADHQDPPLERDDLARGVEDVAAHRIEDHVGAAPAGDLLDPRDEVVGRVVDHLVGTEGRRGRALLRPARRADHVSPESLADLDGRRAHAAGGGVHQQRLARPEPSTVLQRADAGLVGDEHARGLGRRHPVGPRQGRRRVEDGQLGVPAAPDRRGAEHPVTDRGRRALARGHHLAGDLQTRGERQRRLLLVGPLADEDVREVARHRGHPHLHLARTGLRIGHLRPGQDVGGLAELADLPAPHQWDSQLTAGGGVLPLGPGTPRNP